MSDYPDPLDNACAEEAVFSDQACEQAIRNIETRYGTISLPPNNEDLMVKFLQAYGEWAFIEVKFVSSIISDDARVLDGGAFLGTFGLGLFLLHKLKLLCCVEANSLVSPLLEDNLRRNATAPFEVISALLAGPEGSPRVGRSITGNLGSASFREDAAGDDLMPQPAEVTTLAKLRERFGPFDLIKLDIEGMEREVILGDEQYLSQGLTTLWIECNEDAQSLDTLDLVLSWGSEVYYFAFPSHNPDNFRGLLNPVLPWSYEAALLVAPRNQPVLDPELAAHGCILCRVASREALKEVMWLTPRGLPDELATADERVLAAVVSRALRGQHRSSFLQTVVSHNVTTQLTATPEGSACDENLAVSRSTELDEDLRIRTTDDDLPVSRLAAIEQDHHFSAEAQFRLAEVSSIALERLASLGEERDRVSSAEAAAEATAAQLALARAELATIRKTLGWRFVARVNSYVASKPKLWRVLRGVRAAAGVLSGRVRVSSYLQANPEVEAAGITPFVHYVLHGRSDGRSPLRPLHLERSILEVSRPLSIRAKDWTTGKDRETSLRLDSLLRALESVLSECSGLIVSLSHDDYQINIGGVQNLVREERLSFEEIGWAYLHLSPATPLPTLAPFNTETGFQFSLRLGSVSLGTVRIDDLLQTLSTLRRNSVPLVVVVHHLLGTAPEVVQNIASFSSITPIVWVHDYFTICANPKLLRNDVRFCSAPPFDSMACMVCIYGCDREANRSRIESFFRTTIPDVLAPSESTLAFWLSNAGLPFRTTAVQPLARIVFASQSSRQGVQPNRPIRIAHLGACDASKGWLAFERLVRHFASDSRYEFIHLGLPIPDATTVAVRNVPVSVTLEAPNAMIEAVAEHRIDAVLSWSPWPETFCYTAFEAIAGGAFLLTHSNAGNVPALVTGPAAGQGLILQDEEALHALLEYDRLRSLLLSSRRRGVLVREGGTAAWLMQSSEWPLLQREVAVARATDSSVEA